MQNLNQVRLETNWQTLGPRRVPFVNKKNCLFFINFSIILSPLLFNFPSFLLLHVPCIFTFLYCHFRFYHLNLPLLLSPLSIWIWSFSKNISFFLFLRSHNYHMLFIVHIRPSTNSILVVFNRSLTYSSPVISFNLLGAIINPTSSFALSLTSIL